MDLRVGKGGKEVASDKSTIKGKVEGEERELGELEREEEGEGP